MNDLQFINSEAMFGKINYKSKNPDVCKTADQVVARYTTEYDAWLDATNKANMSDCECLCVAVEDMQLLVARIAELEAAQQWHDASEPPDDCRNVEIQTWIGHCYTDFCIAEKGVWAIFGPEVARWRELPPMPQRKGDA